MKIKGIPGDTFIIGTEDTLDKVSQEITDWLNAPNGVATTNPGKPKNHQKKAKEKTTNSSKE
jgi:hypothetical protein